MAPLLEKNAYETLEEHSPRDSDDLHEPESSDRADFARVSYEKSYRRLRIVNIFLIFGLALTAAYALYVRMHPHSNTVLLGTDPFGYVPAGFGQQDVGEPREWVMFDERDPYYIEYDVFDSIEKTEEAVEKLIELDHPGILTHGINTSFHGIDGLVHELRPTTAHRGEEKFPVVFLRAFHQMHCIILFTDAYGHVIHGQETRWEPEHIAHCVNVLRETVSCLADASVASFTYEEDHHIARDQMSYCRNYMALRKWADDPSRAARYDIVENLLPKDH